jgi:hypothetical protein
MTPSATRVPKEDWLTVMAPTLSGEAETATFDRTAEPCFRPETRAALCFARRALTKGKARGVSSGARRGPTPFGSPLVRGSEPGASLIYFLFFGFAFGVGVGGATGAAASTWGVRGRLGQLARRLKPGATIGKSAEADCVLPHEIAPIGRSVNELLMECPSRP